MFLFLLFSLFLFFFFFICVSFFLFIFFFFHIFFFLFFFLEWPTTTTREGRANPNPDKARHKTGVLGGWFGWVVWLGVGWLGCVLGGCGCWVGCCVGCWVLCWVVGLGFGFAPPPLPSVVVRLRPPPSVVVCPPSPQLLDVELKTEGSTGVRSYRDLV